ncbi:MAG: hypothetical protein NTW62_03450 [Candidatus Nomurabacteria bacterium]|nr:hypothetical protein [Candidatus Nomurabacteria bacterium]
MYKVDIFKKYEVGDDNIQKAGTVLGLIKARELLDDILSKEKYKLLNEMHNEISDFLIKRTDNHNYKPLRIAIRSFMCPGLYLKGAIKWTSSGIMFGTTVTTVDKSMFEKIEMSKDDFITTVNKLWTEGEGTEAVIYAELGDWPDNDEETVSFIFNLLRIK